ncbi:MAG TPA: protein kinase, partial [Rubrobacter sp.]|nr:protein kinase [Rubrobacter sp.]
MGRNLIDQRYELRTLVGSGGMADVYLAGDEVLGREVALKLLKDRYAENEEFVERFRREAKSAAALSNPYIVPIFDRGETDDGTYYITMEYLPGGTLRERITTTGALRPQAAAEVALQVAKALQTAHVRGVVHRDIKPRNILLADSDHVKVADFGIARAVEASTSSHSGDILGSAKYMSPEQAVGDQVGPASDLYSLGVVLYEMLTGEVPYDAETPVGIAMKHVNGRLCAPREVDPSIPEGINAITVSLLAKDPENRYPDAASLVEDLDQVGKGLTPVTATMQTANGLPPAAREARIRVPSPAPYPEKKRRRKIFSWVTAAALLAILALIGAMGWDFWQNFQERDVVSTLDTPSMVKVPDVTGQSTEEASGVLRNVGLTVNREYDVVESSEPEGTVLGTDPPAGSEVEAGTSVTLTVSSGTPKEATVEPNAQQPDSAPAPLPDLSLGFVPQQPDPKRSVKDWEQVLEDWRGTQEQAQEETQAPQEQAQG